MKTAGSNGERTAALKATLEKRLDEIEALLDGKVTVLVDEQLPRTLAELRLMSIPEQNIFTIGSPSTLNIKQSPHLSDSIRRAHDLLKRIQTFRRRPVKKAPSTAEQCRYLRRKVRRQSLTIAGLAKSLHEAESERDLQSTRAKTLTRRLAQANEKISELIQANNNRPLHLVKKGEA